MSQRNELEGLPQLEPHIQEFVSTTDGFEHRFIMNLPYYDSHEDAYEATERQYFHVMGRRKYKDYASFRAARSRVARVNRSRAKVSKPRPIKR